MKSKHFLSFLKFFKIFEIFKHFRLWHSEYALFPLQFIVILLFFGVFVFGLDPEQYPYRSAPKRIKDLPISKFNQFLNERACFVWNGSDINGIPFSLKGARTAEINIRFIANDYSSREGTVTVDTTASLEHIWDSIKVLFADSNIGNIQTPVFTLISTASRARPTVIFFTENGMGYSKELWSKSDFAKLLHHGINPMKRWTAASNVVCFVLFALFLFF